MDCILWLKYASLYQVGNCLCKHNVLSPHTHLPILVAMFSFLHSPNNITLCKSLSHSCLYRSQYVCATPTSANEHSIKIENEDDKKTTHNNKHCTRYTNANRHRKFERNSKKTNIENKGKTKTKMIFFSNWTCLRCMFNILEVCALCILVYSVCIQIFQIHNIINSNEASIQRWS